MRNVTQGSCPQLLRYERLSLAVSRLSDAELSLIAKAIRAQLEGGQGSDVSARVLDAFPRSARRRGIRSAASQRKPLN